MPLSAGSRLDSYEIIASLGAGGMGEVYRARDTALKRDVAIKVLPEYWSRDSERLRRFELEAQAAAALNHPNIISIFHVGQMVRGRGRNGDSVGGCYSLFSNRSRAIVNNGLRAQRHTPQ